MNECGESTYARSKAFYLMLTPTFPRTTSKEKTHHEGLMSDFSGDFKIYDDA